MRPTAVFCYNDMEALEAMRMARDRELSIPGDPSVVGLDDLFHASHTDPRQTTVQQPKEQMGHVAAEMRQSTAARGVQTL